MIYARNLRLAHQYLDSRREVYMRGLLLLALLLTVIYCVMNHDQVLSVGEWAMISLHR